MIAFRQITNLSNRVKIMEDFKTDFNNEFSINQIFFQKSFVNETIDIVSKYEKDITYLKNIINNLDDEKECIRVDSFITTEYQRKINEYNSYLDKFHEEFRKRFKVDRMTIIEKIKLRLHQNDIKRLGDE